MSKANPYTIPADPHVTIREIVVYVGKYQPINLHDIEADFKVSKKDASVRLLKLYRWGYLHRTKATEGHRIYHYGLTKFGEKAAKKWGKKKSP